MTQPRRGLGRGLDVLFGGGHPAPPAPAPDALDEAPAEAPAGNPAPGHVPVAPATNGHPGTPATADPAPYVPPAGAAPVASAAAEPAAAYRRGQPEQLHIDLILPNPEQPRTYFEPEKLRELSDSIHQHGILQPLVVTRDETGTIVLIAGERRLQAARLAGLETVPVVFRDTSDSELLELALIENIQRADLNAIEEAQAYRRLIDEYGLTQEDAARRVGKSRAAVANSLRLLGLEPEIRQSLVGGEISEGHARALLGIPEGRARVAAWREVVKRRLSVRDTEAHVRKVVAGVANGTATGNGHAPSAAARRDAHVADIEARLRRALSTRVSVTPVREGARITIECYSAEEFGNVVDQLLGDYE